MTIRDAISFYKENISKYWEDEKYKWVAVKHFQDSWNTDAEDFAGMLAEAFRFSNNLLSGGMYYAYKMLCLLAEQDPEKMRSLFKLLYNENLPLIDRLQPFRSGCDELLAAFRESAPDRENAKNHYQDLRALCVYLSFKYPETYFLYKSRMYRNFKNRVGYQEFSAEKNSEIRKYDNFALLCHMVLKEIEGDSELQQMQRGLVDNDSSCYKDSALHLLTQTIIYVSENMDSEKTPLEKIVKGAAVADEDVETRHYWLYSPGDGASIWNECCKDGIMAIGWDEIGDLRAFSSKDEMKTAMRDALIPTCRTRCRPMQHGSLYTR